MSDDKVWPAHASARANVAPTKSQLLGYRTNGDLTDSVQGEVGKNFPLP